MPRHTARRSTNWFSLYFVILRRWQHIFLLRIIIDLCFLSKIVEFVLPTQRNIAPAVIKKVRSKYSTNFLLNLHKSSASMNPINAAPAQKAEARNQWPQGYFLNLNLLLVFSYKSNSCTAFKSYFLKSSISYSSFLLNLPFFLHVCARRLDPNLLRPVLSALLSALAPISAPIRPGNIYINIKLFI